MTIKTFTTAVLLGLFSVSMAQAKGKKKTFEELDTDKNSKLSEAEFIAGKKDAEKAKKRFKKLDKDSDGSLTKEEFKAKKPKKKKKPAPKKDEPAK